MLIRCFLNSMVCCVLVLWIFLNCFPGFVLTAVVTLDSIEIYKTHECLKTKRTIYFHCKGEKKTILPDVKKTDVEYAFKGEESWQPLTELSDQKCKQCGLYEDYLKSDYVYDEWELCPSDFRDGKYTREKEKEFTAAFLCRQCHSKTTALILSSGGAAMIIQGVDAIKCWLKKKKRQQELAQIELEFYRYCLTTVREQDLPSLWQRLFEAPDLRLLLLELLYEGELWCCCGHRDDYWTLAGHWVVALLAFNRDDLNEENVLGLISYLVKDCEICRREWRIVCGERRARV